MLRIVLDCPPDVTRTARLLEFCLAAGVDAFAVHAYAATEDWPAVEQHIFAPLAPHSLGMRNLEHTVTWAGQTPVRPTECWRFNPTTAVLITAISGGRLVTTRHGDPEDWTFYRNDTLFLGVVSHEHFVYLDLTDTEERAFAALGIPYTRRDH